MMDLVTFFNKAQTRIALVRNKLIIRFKKGYRKFYSDQHQLTSFTGINRYPKLFQATQEAINQQNNEVIRILSFGCSTGEECFTLREYFPKASIIGVDINKANLRKAQSRNTEDQIKFMLSNEENIQQNGPYHIIYCLSVLCRWEDTKDLDNCEKVYQFSKFEETLEFLSEQLCVNGCLVIYNSNFCFEDTKLFSQYKVVDSPLEDSGFVHKFDKHHNRLTTHHKNCIYRKLQISDP